MQLPSPSHPLNWEPFKASCPWPVALGAEQRQPQAASCHLCPCSSTKRHSWEASGGFIFPLFFFSSENSRFFSFSWKHICFKLKFAQPFGGSPCISPRQPQGVSSFMEWVPYRNPNSLRHPSSRAMLWGGTYTALSPHQSFQ